MNTYIEFSNLLINKENEYRSLAMTLPKTTSFSHWLIEQKINVNEKGYS